MTAETFEDVFEGIFDEALQLLIERQSKYGPSNIEEQGMYGVFQRIARDKLARLKMSLNGEIVNGEVILNAIVEHQDESFEDTLMDIANYALIMVALKRGVWGKPLRNAA